MQLTADMFVQIVDSLRTDALGGGMREQRKRPRVGVNGRTNILIPAKTGAKPIPVTVRDISAAGIGLLLTESLLAVGEEFLLVLAQGQKQAGRMLVYQVKRSARLSTTLHLIGANLVREAQVDLSAARKPPAAPPHAPAKSTGAATYAPPEAVAADADAAAVNEVEARLRKLTA
jgi:hypothetical protein